MLKKKNRENSETLCKHFIKITNLSDKKNEYIPPCDYWTRTSKQSLCLIETDGKLLRRVSLDNKLLYHTVAI